MSSLTALSKYFEQIKFETHIRTMKSVYTTQTYEKKNSNTILSIASVVDKTQTHIREYCISDFAVNVVCRMYPLMFFVEKKEIYKRARN